MFDNVAQSQNPTSPSGKPDGGSSSSPPILLRRPAAVLEVPVGAVKPEEPGLIIHAIPKEYYDVAPKIMIKKTGQVAPKTPPLPPSPPKPTPPPLPKTPISSKKKVPVVLIIGIILFVVVAMGGFLFLQSLKQPAAPSVVIEPPPEPTPEPTPEPEPEPIPEPIRPGVDTDSDGLTDVEELTIFKSDPRNPDSDGDSFIDGNEVFHLYDPARSSSVILDEENANVRFETLDSFVMLVPISWFRRSEALEHEATFVTGKGETINVILESGSTLESASPTFSSGKDLMPFRSKQGYAGARSPDYTDSRTVILQIDETTVAIFEYDLGESRIIDFLRTFEMMINSFKLL